MPREIDLYLQEGLVWVVEVRSLFVVVQMTEIYSGFLCSDLRSVLLALNRIMKAFNE